MTTAETVLREEIEYRRDLAEKAKLKGATREAELHEIALLVVTQLRSKYRARLRERRGREGK